MKLDYSYFNPCTGSNFAAFIAGKIDTIIVINIELSEITKMDIGFISDGIVLKKYISSGNKLILKTELKNCRKFSTYFEKVIPKIIPKKVADVPIIKPIKKNILNWY